MPIFVIVAFVMILMYLTLQYRILVHTFHSPRTTLFKKSRVPVHSSSSDDAPLPKPLKYQDLYPRMDLENPHLDNVIRNTELNIDEFMSEDGCDFSALVNAFHPEKLQVNCNNFHELVQGEEIGEGYWRKAYLSTFRNKTVVIKRIQKELAEEYGKSSLRRRHTREAAILYQMRNSPHVVRMLGFCNDTSVMEYVPGNLKDIVLDENVAISVKEALQLCLDAAKGIVALHTMSGGPVAHRDIDICQLLITKEGVLKVNDFNRLVYVGPNLLPGKSSEKCLYNSAVYGGKIRSPEEYDTEEEETEKLDIYSLSLIFWQIQARKTPFEDIEEEDVYEQVKAGTLLPSSEDMENYPKAMQDLIIDMLKRQPEDRPTAIQVVDRITDILETFLEEEAGEKN